MQSVIATVITTRFLNLITMKTHEDANMKRYLT